jgi:hypothetical protein
MPELSFVLGSTASPALGDLVAALAGEVARQDAVAAVVSEFPDPRPYRVAVVFNAEPEAQRELSAAEMTRTIEVVTISPGSGEFAAAAGLAARAGAAFHVNSAGLEQMFAAGVPARHLQLGFSPDWPDRPAEDDGLAVIEGQGYFDWVEALAAIHRGDVVLHEHSLGMPPLVAGRHVFVATSESLDLVGDLLRQDERRLESVREEASAFCRTALPLAIAAAALIGAARAGVAQPLGAASSSARPAA